jgi:acyl-CoA synthetase (AMP-forming)/AMP-acid ligase II
MGPATFVIAILGCADGGTACTPVATLQTRYESEALCAAATGAALIENSNFDYPTLVARCRQAPAAKSADAQETPRDKPRRG